MIWETSVGYGNEIVGSNDGGGQRGLALGNRLTVKGEEAVAVGTDASATAGWAITMGTKSSAEKETSMAFWLCILMRRSPAAWRLAHGV